MMPLPIPRVCGARVFRECAEQRRDAALRTRLANTRARVYAAEIQYRVFAGFDILHMFINEPPTPGIATDQDLVELYETALVASGARGRGFYDEILGSAPHGRCPYCGVGVVRTLDHFLPKAHYAVLSVCPLNLVPCCRDCNVNKGALYAKEAGSLLIHPYFVERACASQPWLEAEIVPSQGGSVASFVVSQSITNRALRSRFVTHFTRLRLGELYGLQAASAFPRIQERLDELRHEGGARLVGEYLEREARFVASQRDCIWEGAMYRALASCRELIEGEQCLV